MSHEEMPLTSYRDGDVDYSASYLSQTVTLTLQYKTSI